MRQVAQRGVTASRALRIGLPAAVLVLAAVVALVLLRGDDATGSTLVPDPGSGYALRGSLAEDQEAIDAAVRAWRDGEEPGTRPAPHDDVVVYWAGALPGRDVVVMGSEDSAQIVERRGGEEPWRVSSHGTIAGSPTFPQRVSFANRAALVPEDGGTRYIAASQEAERIALVEGLLIGEDPDAPLPAGIVLPLPAEELASDGARVVTVGPDGQDVLVRRVGRPTVRAMNRLAAAGRGAQLAAAIDAGAPAPGAGRPDTSGEGEVAVVASGPLGRAEPAVVVRTQTLDFTSLALGWMEPGEEPRGISLGIGPELPPRTTRPLVGYAYLGESAPPLLVAAASGNVKRIEILAGKRRHTRPAPLAAVPMSGSERDDTVVYGIDGAGAVVRALAD